MTDIPLSFRVRPMLTNGGIGWGGKEIFIMIAEGQDKCEAIETAWHEVVHMLRMTNPDARVAIDLSEKELEVEEELVSSFAKRLSSACPEILEWCGLEDKFKE